MNFVDQLALSAFVVNIMEISPVFLWFKFVTPLWHIESGDSIIMGIGSLWDNVCNPWEWVLLHDILTKNESVGATLSNPVSFKFLVFLVGLTTLNVSQTTSSNDGIGSLSRTFSKWMIHDSPAFNATQSFLSKDCKDQLWLKTLDLVCTVLLSARSGLLLAGLTFFPAAWSGGPRLLVAQEVF